MVKTSATSQTQLASNAKPLGQHPQKSDSADNSGKAPIQAAFTSTAIGMSWQLAIIVLLPILGGYKLDSANHSSPLWTLLGMTLALVGSIFVIRKALAKMNNFSVPTAGDQNEVKHD